MREAFYSAERLNFTHRLSAKVLYAMSVILRPVGLLKPYCRNLLNEQGQIEMLNREGYTLEAVCQDIGLPVELVSLYIVNGRAEGSSYRLRTGDDVKFVAIIGGG